MVKAKVTEKDTGSMLISQKEMLDRENKYLQRMQDVSVSCGFIKEATTEYNRLEAQQTHDDHWQHYIRCDGLPRTFSPPEMRTFMAKKRHYQQFDYDHSVDWTLSVDERTILTQDIFRTDKTKKAMKETLNDHIGDRFEQDVFMLLDTLVKIECMLDNNTEMSRVTFDLQMEIMEVRSELEKEIDAAFDRLTYRIIRMDGVYLDSSDATVATWGHKCDRYAMDIWGLRNVPIRFNELIAPLMVAELVHVRVSVQMPLSVLHDCMTLRCIHTMFDNYSQYAKSFDPMIPESIKDLSAGIIDIEDCLANEWLMQLDVQEELLETMLQKREAYEEAIRIIAEKTEKAAKEKKANTDGKKTKAVAIPKAPREVPAVPPGMMPDAYPTFLEREQQEYVDFLDQLYNPKNLKLMLDEINLRQYILLGGLYSIMFVRRPSNTHFEKFNIILHEDGRVLHTMEDIVADLRPKKEELSRPGSKMSQRASNLSQRRSRMRLNMDQQKRKTIMLEDDELPYFFVTIQLPKELCMWGEPIVCQYMTDIQEVISDTSLVEEKKESTMEKKKKKSKAGSLRRLSANRSSIFTKIVRKSAISENVFRPTLISLLRQSKHQPPGVWVAPIHNFSLLKQLNHLEIRQLERYGIPRTISSLKFPMEVRAELEQMQDKGPKTKNMLMRRRSADIEEVVDFGDIDFSFEDQDAPERVFPVFSDVETPMYSDKYFNEYDEEFYDKKSMYGLLNTLDNIRLKYQSKHVAIMGQTGFDTKKAKEKKIVVPMPEARLTPTIAKNKSLSQRHSSARGSNLHISNVSSRTGSSFHIADNATPPELSISQSSVIEEVEKPKVKVIHWTTKHILSTKFNRTERTMTIRTDRLGTFGLAFKRYEHFPFRDWSMQPNEENPDEVTLTVDTFHARIVLFISAQGVRGYVTDITKGYVAHPVKYLDIPTPIADFRILRKKFYDKCINIFAEHDASYYIDNGYFSVKHVATEDHTYDAMALHCKLMKFYRSSWNRLASRRNILLCMKNAKDQSDYTEVTIRLTPDTATFVEVSELCSDDLDVIKLDFKNTWRNMAHYTDLHQTITSMNPHATDVRNKDALLLFRIKRMLSEIHLMSYS